MDAPETIEGLDYDFRQLDVGGELDMMDFLAYRPPKEDFGHDEYGHLVDKSGRQESSRKQECRKMLSCMSPRSPGAEKIEHYDLSISGNASFKKQRSIDRTIGNVELKGTNNNAAKSKTLNQQIDNLCNNYDRVLMILNEKLQELDKIGRAHKRKANDPSCRNLWAGLMKDTVKLNKLLLATITIIEADESDDKDAFSSYDLNNILEETDFQITVKTIQRWYCTNGKLYKSYTRLANHFRQLKRRHISWDSLELSETGFAKIDEATTRCLERMDAISDFLQRFDMRNAATAVLAAVRWKNATSPTNNNTLPSSRWSE